MRPHASARCRRLSTVIAATTLAVLVAGCDSQLAATAETATSSTTTTARAGDSTPTTDTVDASDSPAETGSDESTTTGPSGTASTTTDATSTDASAAATGFREFPEPVITVTDPGTDPEVRRFAFTVGDTRTMIERTMIHMDQTVNGKHIVLDYSGTMRAKVTIRSVDDGLATIRQVITAYDITFDKPVPKETKAMMEQIGTVMVGVTVDLKVDSRGNILSSTPDPSTLPRSASLVGQVINTLDSSTGAAARPWPTEPVGVGATWTQVSVAENPNTKSTTTSHVTLTSIEGGVVTLDSVVSTEIADVPGAPAKASGTAEGTTTRIVNNSRYLDQTGHGEMTTDSTTQMASMEMNLSLEVTSDASYEP